MTKDKNEIKEPAPGENRFSPRIDRKKNFVF
jgi:hypothetical protein